MAADRRTLVDYFLPPTGPRERPPGFPRDSDDDRGFWLRHFWPVSAFGGTVVVVALALAVAVVTTVIYATTEAAKPIAADIEAEGPIGTLPTLPPSVERGTTTSRPSGDGGLSRLEVGEQVGLQVVSVSTFDAEGTPVFGSGFLAGSTGGQALVITSLSLVRDSTVDPELEISVLGSSGAAPAQLWNFHAATDLALLLVEGPGGLGLPLAVDAELEVGEVLYLVTPGGAAFDGVVEPGTDEDSVIHDLDVDGRAQGAPVVNSQGEVVAIASLAYGDPDGRGSPAATAVPISRACERVLSCGDRQAAPGARSSA